MNNVGFVVLVSVMLQIVAGQDNRLHEQAVYEAVVAHTIQPIAARGRPAVGGTPPAILVRDQTVGLCDEWPHQVPAGCVHERVALQHFDGTSSGGTPHVGLGLPVDTRTQLIARFRMANQKSRPLVGQGSSVMRPLSRAQEAEMRQGEGHWTVAVAELSVPAFSTDGHALMFGRYSCGTECGYSWIFLLRFQEGRWRVTEEFLISIS